MSSIKPLEGKVALITGASKGIGAATALQLASLGAKVVVNYSTNPTPAEELVQKIGPSNAIAIKANAGNLQEIQSLVQQTISWSGGKIDILIPNAATSNLKSVAETSEADFDATYTLNVKGPYFLVQAALPYLSRGSSVILLSTSLCALTSITPNYLLYVSSKGAVEQMTRVLAKDLGTKGINVNAVAPGPTGTELFYQDKTQETVDRIASLSPMGRLGKPEEIAEAIAWLAGGGGSWVNGQILRVNGGMTV